MIKNVGAKKTIETCQNRYNAICYSKESEESKTVLLVKTLQKTIKDIEDRHDINISNTKNMNN